MQIQKIPEFIVILCFASVFWFSIPTVPFIASASMEGVFEKII